jgi:hypothetical protein
MRYMVRKVWLVSIMVLLIAAQTGAVAHEYTHDPGTSQDLSCFACVTAGNLLAGCVETGAAISLERELDLHFVEQLAQSRSADVHIARQRGPPATL